MSKITYQGVAGFTIGCILSWTVSVTLRTPQPARFRRGIPSPEAQIEGTAPLQVPVMKTSLVQTKTKLVHTKTRSLHTTEMSHVLVDAFNLPADFLDSTPRIVQMLDGILATMGFNVVGNMSHQFTPHGMTALWLLTESHASIHTWPEEGYAAFDFLTCGEADLLDGAELLHQALKQIAPEVDFRFSHVRRGARQPKQVDDVAVVTSELHTEKKRVTRKKSAYQKIEVWDVSGRSWIFGDRQARNRMLFLDGVMQVSTSDEAIYHESLVHPVMSAHPEPKQVCIMGGGDGGALREVLQHRSVMSAFLVELDEAVTRVAEEFFPSLSVSFHDPRASLVFEDAFAWIHKYAVTQPGGLDIIIVDLLDVTVDSSLIDFLYTGDRLGRFVGDVKAALGEDGAVVVQLGELPTRQFCLEAAAITDTSECRAARRQIRLVQSLESVFRHVHVYSVWVPSWLGEWTFVVATDSLAVEQRWSQSAASLNADLPQRLLQREKLSYFHGTAMQRMQVLPPTWVSVREDFQARRNSTREAVGAEACPHLTSLAPRSDLPGFQVPYMLARSKVTNGLGVYTLRRISQGETIWRFHNESFLPVTQQNWKAIVGGQLKRRNWKSASDLDAAASKGGEAGIRGFLRQDWINEWPTAARDDPASMMLELDDGKYINHGYSTHQSEVFMGVAQSTSTAYAKGRVIVALRGIEACEELMENYFSDDGEDSDGYSTPGWWEDVLGSYSILDYIRYPAYRYTASRPANQD